MDYKAASRMIYNMPEKKAVTRGRSEDKEDAIVGAIDMKRNIEQYTKLLAELQSGKKDIPQALSEVSPQALITMMEVLSSGSEKGKIAAASDLLDRAGFSKVNRHAVATVDAGQSKEALLSLLLGAKKDLASEGIEIVDDREDTDTTE